MLTTLFAIFATLNAILLIGLFGILYLKGQKVTDSEYNKLDRIENYIILGLFTGITITIILSVFLII